MPKTSTPARQRRDPARTRAELLEVATAEFARVGYFGARVDEIAAKTASTKRMLYYYFGDKEGLFTAALENAYAKIRAAEQALDLATMAPLEGIARLIEHTFRYHEGHPELSRLVAAENLLGAVHLRASANAQGINRPVIGILDDLITRGQADGSIKRKDVDALDLHLAMSAAAFYRQANAATVEATFGVVMGSPTFRDRQIAMFTEMMTQWLSTSEDQLSS